MNQVGSVSLIASLAFAVFALVAGAVGGKLRSARITRSAERATLGFFLMVTLAVVALEYMISHQRLPQCLCGRAFQSRLAGLLQSCGAVGWAGRLAALLDVAAFDLQRPGGLAEPQQESPIDALRGLGADGRGHFLFSSRLFRRQSLSGTLLGIQRRHARFYRCPMAMD